MTIRDTPWAAGTPCWVDLMSTDIDSAKRFYSTLFGWNLVEGPPETGGYVMADVDGRNVGAMMPMQEPLLSMGHPSAWTTYLATDDAAATAARVTAAGGTLMQEPIEVMEHGVMAIGTDVTQAGFGLWQAKAHIGFQLANAANAVTWNEMMSRDFEKAKAFYAAVFGYTYTDMSADGFKYATIEVGGNTVGGIGELPAEVPAEVPAHWRVYFDVDDADKAAAQVVELGGQVISPPRDMPYGRYADVTDAQGGHFSVIKSAQPA